MGDGPRVCIFGAGAIGGYLAVQLHRAGIATCAIARGAHLAAIRSRGLALRIGGHEHVAMLPASDRPADFGAQDYVIVTLKADQVKDAVNSMTPLLGPHTTVVTASNGLPYWFFDGVATPWPGGGPASLDPDGRQHAVFGDGRALGMVVFPATEVVAPGVVQHEHGARFPVGEPGGTRSERAQTLCELLGAAGFDAPLRDDIRDEIWLKLWGNLCLNPVSALTLATVDVVATDAGTRAICEAMMNEAKTIGERLGLRLRVDSARRLDGAAALGPHKMSMLQDLERGRPLETEALVGIVQELGRLVDVPTPTLDVVLALLRLRATRH